MPDIFDPYEERGVPNPHRWEGIEPVEVSRDGHGASNVPAPKMTPAEVERERERLKARELRRIRPGFYEGTEPLGDGLG